MQAPKCDCLQALLAELRVQGRVGGAGKISCLDVDILCQSKESSAYGASPAIIFALIARDGVPGCILRFLSLASLPEK